MVTVGDGVAGGVTTGDGVGTTGDGVVGVGVVAGVGT